MASFCVAVSAASSGSPPGGRRVPYSCQGLVTTSYSSLIRRPRGGCSPHSFGLVRSGGSCLSVWHRHLPNHGPLHDRACGTCSIRWLRKRDTTSCTLRLRRPLHTSLGLTCPVSDHGRAPGRACATTGRGPASSWHRVRSPFPLRLPAPSGSVYVGDPERYPHPGKPAHRGALLEYLTPQGTSPVAGSAALCVLAAVAAWAIRVPCSPSVGQQAMCHWPGSPIDPPPL